MAINFTKPTNGYLFDLTAETGAGTIIPSYIFRATTGSIHRVELYNDRVAYTDSQGTNYNISCDGTNYKKLTIDGVTYESNLELFNALIALL